MKTGASPIKKIVEIASILAVDDDPVFLKVVAATLNRVGYKVVTAGDLASAKALLDAAGGPEAFACALIDHRLPDGDGTQVLKWVRPHESGAAAIMVTASGDRGLIRETMIAGACDFLQKPVSPKDLRSAVARALASTQHRRRAEENHRAVQSVAQMHRHLLSAIFPKLPVDYRFYPRNECGGDFLNHHHLPDGSDVYILSDVSGHDFRSASISAFFHGWMGGILKAGGEIEDALESFNQRMLGPIGEIAGSIAVTVLKVEPGRKCVTAWNCGGLPPVFVDWWGGVRWMGARSSSPLGWFDHIKPTRVNNGVPPSPVWIWTDGLESLADAIGASPLSVAYALLEAPPEEQPLWLGWSHDDILVTRIWPNSSAGLPQSYFHPLVAEECETRAEGAIDSLQAHWKTSLGIALPEIPADTLHDVLLGAREALLNAVKHGCYGCETASFQILYNPKERVLRVRVADPGPGHEFDWCAKSTEEPSGRQCGMTMIHCMASRVTMNRNGAELMLDFFLSPELRIMRDQDAA